jgi:hypothetical protein
MSLFNSVLGGLSPRLTDSFEDPHAREHEQSSLIPRIPPPIAASNILWNTPKANMSPAPRIPDELLVIQRKARHLEQQLQELLDAQADGLLSGLTPNEATPDDLISNGSTTPTVSSMRGGTERLSSENEEYTRAPRPKKLTLNTARKRISHRIQQLASVKAEELDILDESLHSLSTLLSRTDSWTQKRIRLSQKISSITSSNDTPDAPAQTLQSQASALEQEIRQKEQELHSLKIRHRTLLQTLASTENSLEAKLSTYKASLGYLDKEITDFLARPPPITHTPQSSSPFYSLPAHRRTLEMAQEYWHEEHERLAERCEEVDTDRAALDEGAMLWTDVTTKVIAFETSLQNYLAAPSSADPSTLLSTMDTTVTYLEETLELAQQRGWNLLVCAIGAELEAFKQGQEMLEQALGLNAGVGAKSRAKGKGKARDMEKLVDTESSHGDSQAEIEEQQVEELSKSAFRIGPMSPPIPKPKSVPKPISETLLASPPSQPTQHKFFDTDDDEDPDPELMISHQDTDKY